MISSDSEQEEETANVGVEEPTGSAPSAEEGAHPSEEEEEEVQPEPEAEVIESTDEDE